MKKVLEKEFKIRRLLGDNYHLNTIWDVENERIKEWKLFKNYKNQDLYFSEFNEAIMTSEDSTEKDLLKFARKNHIYDFERLHTKKGLYISIALLVLCIVNAFIRSDFIRGMFYGATIYLWIDLILNWIVGNHNFKIEMKLLNDKFDITKKMILEEINGKEEKLKEEKEKNGVQ